VTSPFLVADCVSKSFDGRRVLSSASLRAVPGEVRALLGRSGEGKSTLMRIAAGWLHADAGIVQCEGETLIGVSPHALARRGVFYLPDRGVLSSALTVRQQLEMIAERFPGAMSVAAAADVMGISSLIDVRPQTLSGGERRRADIAAALVRRPRCLLADEPLRGIAPIDAEALVRTFRAMAAEGCAVVVTGHDVEMLLDGADHITRSTSGTTYEIGSPATARAHEGLRIGYLGR
jgi:lipopolysaccharide export system ATP-binding protein